MVAILNNAEGLANALARLMLFIGAKFFVECFWAVFKL